MTLKHALSMYLIDNNDLAPNTVRKLRHRLNCYRGSPWSVRYRWVASVAAACRGGLGFRVCEIRIIATSSDPSPSDPAGSAGR